MKVQELNPYDHWVSEVDADGYWHETNPLPIDEWRCTGCSAEVGYTTFETNESTGMGWKLTWIPLGSDPLKADATRFCEDCAQDHQVVEA